MYTTSQPLPTTGDKIGLSKNWNGWVELNSTILFPPFTTKSPGSQIACPILKVVELLVWFELTRYVFVSLSSVIPGGPSIPGGPWAPFEPLIPGGPCGPGGPYAPTDGNCFPKGIPNVVFVIVCVIQFFTYLIKKGVFRDKK